MIALYPYIEIERDGAPVRLIATEPWCMLESISELGQIWAGISHRLEMAVVIDGRTICYL